MGLIDAQMRSWRMRSSTISAVCSVITFPPLEKGRKSLLITAVWPTPHKFPPISKLRYSRRADLCRPSGSDEFAHESLCVFQIGGVEAFCKPVIDWRE